MSDVKVYSIDISITSTVYCTTKSSCPVVASAGVNSGKMRENQPSTSPFPSFDLIAIVYVIHPWLWLIYPLR
jgi:hypothetical protein